MAETDIEWADINMAHRLGGNPKTPQYAGLTRDARAWAGETLFKKDAAGRRELDGQRWEQFPASRKAVAA